MNVDHTHIPKKRSVTMLTRREIHQTAEQRISLITQEFKNGFEFLKKFPRSVTVFGGVQIAETDPYYKKARSLGKRIATDLHYAVITGGGPGIMEAASRGAREGGAKSVGLTIQLPHEQITNPYLTDHLDFHYFFSRKVCLSFAAEAYVFFPGGFGTLDEFFEIITLVQTKKIEKVPVILVGTDFWNNVETMMRNELLSRGTVEPNDLKLYHITDNEDEIMHLIQNAPVRNGLTHDTIPMSPLVDKKCIPCEEKTNPLSHAENEKMSEEITNWTLIEDTHLEKVFLFENFTQALAFVDTVGSIAESEQHHPDIQLFEYKKVKIILTTHAIGGLSENDFILASKIDDVIRGK
jgi:uncharacterized protein (TIGR00730 family)